MRADLPRRLLLGATLALGLTAAGVAGAAERRVAPIHALPPHAAQLLEHAGLAPAARSYRPPPARPLDQHTGERPISFGYLPYWTLDAEIPWAHLTHLAYFAVGTTAGGELGDRHGWGDETARQIVDEAHDHGVKVHLTFILFNESAIEELLSDAGRRGDLAAAMAEEAAAGDADGINIDFEGVPRAVKEELVSFVLEVGSELEARIPGGEMSLAMPAVDWSGSYDYDLLAAASDQLFLMCYGYYWSGGNPGPVAPLDGSERWGQHAIDWTVDDYVEWGGGESVLDRIVVGLPSYGYDWPAEGPDVPGRRRGEEKARSRSYAAVLDGEGFEAYEHDEASDSRYRVYEADDGWRQVFMDDAATTARKIAWALDRGVAGYGFWAIGYDGNDPGYWDAIAEVVGAPVGPPAAADPGPTANDVGEPANDAGAAIGDPGQRDAGAPGTQDPGPPDPGTTPDSAAAPQRDEGLSVDSAHMLDTAAEEPPYTPGSGPPAGVSALSGGGAGGDCSAGTRPAQGGRAWMLWLALLVLASARSRRRGGQS